MTGLLSLLSRVAAALPTAASGLHRRNSFVRLVHGNSVGTGACLAAPLIRSSQSGETFAHRLAPTTAWLAGLSCVAMLFSIAASQILLAAALVSLLLSRRKLRFPPRLAWPLLGFAGWTVLAVLLSPDPLGGLSQVRKLFVFSVLIVVASGFRNRNQVWRTIEGMLMGGGVAALYGLLQFARDYRAVQERGADFYDAYVVHQITGFMSHWMTYGGQLMLVLFLLLAIQLFASDGGRQPWRWLLAAILVAALLAAFTRGIWLGTLAGITLLVAFYRRWMVAVIPVLVLILYLLSPSWLQRRNQSIFHPQGDSSSMSRLVMFQVGVRMIAAHPLFGLGPERIGEEFHRYTPPGIELPAAWYGHLHNIYLQIAAERGIPCIIILLWFFVEVARDALRRAREAPPQQRSLAMASLAATAGLAVSGLFEYNIGDSEVLMLYLFLVSVPVAWTNAESSLTAKQDSVQPI